MRSRLDPPHIQALANVALRARELRLVLQALHTVGLVPVLLKGAAFLAAQAYPESAPRPMGDLDLWLLPEHIDTALDVLQRLGYRPIHKPLRPLPLRRQYEQEVELSAAWPGGSVVDLHYWPFQGMWGRLVARIPQRDLWQRRRLHTWDGLPYALLAPEDHLLHLLYHSVVNHQMADSVYFPPASAQERQEARKPVDHLGEVAPPRATADGSHRVTALRGNRVLADVAVSLHTWPVDWDQVVARARAWHIATVIWLGLTFVCRQFPDVAPEEVVQQLAPSPARQRLLRRFLPAPGVVLPARGRHRYLLYLALCDSPRAWARLVAWALWPERAWLQTRYGGVSPGVRLKHIARAFTQPRF